MTQGERSRALTDDGLVRRAAQGDLGAFDALVAGRIDRCFRLAWSILGNEADAADATQEAFVAAWQMLPRLRDTAAFDGWLSQIVVNRARMARRGRSRRREVQVTAVATDQREPVEWAAVEGPAQPSESDAVVERDGISRAFGRLRPEERSVLVLHHVERRPVQEIARTLGIPVGTAKWRLHAARKALERALEAEA
jgi:RNA polymerase sigma-70 factor (ECF subfamily)